MCECVCVCVCVCVCAQSLSHVWLFATPWIAGIQAPLSMGFSRQEYWVGPQAILQGVFPTQGLNSCLLHLLHRQADSFPLHHLASWSCCSPWVAESDMTEWLNWTLGKPCLRLKWNISKSSFFSLKIEMRNDTFTSTCLLLSSEMWRHTHTLVNLWCWKVHWFW